MHEKSSKTIYIDYTDWPTKRFISVHYKQGWSSCFHFLPPKQPACSVTMVTLKLHKTREGCIYETFISGLIWLFHRYYCCAGPASGVATASSAAGTCAQTAGGLSLQSIVSPSAGDVTARSLSVEVTTNPLHSISLGHKFIFQTNCSGSVGSTVFLISLHFALLIRHHLSWPSKRWKADRRPRRVLDRGAKSDSDSDSPFWDCQSVACNVSWHFHKLQPFPKCSLFYFR